MCGSPPRIRWCVEAAKTLHELAVRGSAGSAVSVIAVTGPVGAGKSTVARHLSPVVLRSDDYLPDYELVSEELRDLPESSDLGRLGADLAELRAGRRVAVPVWSFQTHRREGERWVEPARFVVVEGIHAFEVADRVRVDLKVFVEALPSTRWTRWEAIERAGERGWGVERALRYFEGVAEPTFRARRDRLCGMAEVFVDNE